MMILVVGGSGSGKSAYAEECIAALSGDCKKYYIATMQVFDEEGQSKVKRHQRMRDGKGFCTIEQPLAVEKALDQTGCIPVSGRTALLECVSNLTANEMFSGDRHKAWETVADNIMQGVEQLVSGFQHLVIVTNNVFEDGIDYDETTRAYIKAMGSINERLAAMADRVVEVVVGIPVIVKEGK